MTKLELLCKLGILDWDNADTNIYCTLSITRELKTQGLVRQLTRVTG
jgi:hypothetical protein